MEEEKVLAVLEWLRDVLGWCADNPSRIDEAMAEISRNAEVVREALTEALEDDLKDYAGVVYELITGKAE